MDGERNKTYRQKKEIKEAGKLCMISGDGGSNSMPLMQLVAIKEK